MQVKNTRPGPVPHPETLRSWVQDCLALLNVSAASVSRQIGMGRNTVGEFLGRPGRDIAMSTAHVLTCKLREIAVEKGVLLPRIGERSNG